MSDSDIGGGGAFTGLVLVLVTVYLLYIREIEAALLTLAMLVVLALGFYYILFKHMGRVAEMSAEYQIEQMQEHDK